MKRISTLFIFLFISITIFGQKETPILNGSKEPMPVDNTEVSTITLPLALKPKPSLLPKAITAFSSSMTFIPNEIEPNGTAATAMPLNSIDVKIRGNIFPNADIDFYSFQAVAGDKVYAATMTSFSSSGSNDSQLSLIGSDGTTVIEFDDENGSLGTNSSSIAGAMIPTTGTYYLKVNHFSLTQQLRPYDLYLKVQRGSPTAEVEPNDAPATATTLPANGWISGARSPAVASEQDWYAVTLNAGETLFMSLDLDPERDGTTWNGRLGFGTLGDASNQILVIDDTGAAETPTTISSEAFFFTVKTTGTYYVFIDSATAATGGPTATYHLSVSKLDAPTGYTTYASTDVPKTIGPNPTDPLATSTITIPDNKVIKDLRIQVVLNHALMADIDAILTTPEGNKIALFTDIGATATGGQNLMDATFGDFNAIPPTFQILKGVALMPELASKFDQLRGMKANGVWTLQLYDDGTNALGGTLTSWAIDILEEPLSTQVASYTTIYNADFEADDNGFTHTGTGDQWARGTPATVATFPTAAFLTANSGVNCWKTNLTGTYNVSTIQTLKSPTIFLSSASGNMILSWAMKYQMESANFDHLKVIVQEVGGANPKEVFVWLGATQTTTAGNPTLSIPMSSGWGTYYADVSEYKGKNIEFVVLFDSDDSVNLGGVAIDDVSILSCSTPIGTANSNICSGATASLSATCVSSTVAWYGSNSTTLLYTGSPFVTPALTANTNYNVRCESGVCNSALKLIEINVTEVPTVNPISNQEVCNGVTTTAVNFTGAIPGTKYTWTNTNPSIGLAANGTGNIATFSAINTGTTPITATITVTPTNTPPNTSPAPEILFYDFNGTGTSIPNRASTPPLGAENATIQGGITQGGTGICSTGTVIGTGVSATTDFINSGWKPNLGNNSWTISFKTANITPTSTVHYVFGEITTSSFRCFTNGVAGANNWILRGAGITDVIITGGATVAPHTITFVYDNTLNNIKGYLDGQLVATVSQGILNLTGTNALKVAGYSSNIGLNNGGLLDDFRIYNRPLNTSEIELIANCDNVLMCSGTPQTFTITVSPIPTVPTGIANANICSGTTASLSATCPVGSLAWFNAQSGGSILSTANPFVTPTLSSPATYFAECRTLGLGNVSEVFNFTGGVQTFTVPAGVSSITIEALGAGGGTGATGGNAATGGVGGKGSKATGTLAVTPGQVLTIFVGGQGGTPIGGFNGGGTGGNQNSGGGGGASDIRFPGAANADRIIVAGGGGGGGRAGCIPNTVAGGAGGSGDNNGVNGTNSPSGGGGAGAIGFNAGAAGVGCSFALGSSGINGLTGQGGAGGGGQTCCCNTSIPGGGGGGGGFTGGGGGGGGSAGTVGCTGQDKGAGGGGAGGTSYTGGTAAGTIIANFQTGNGQITITYPIVLCESGRVPVQVAIIGSNLNLTTNISGTSILASSNTITATNSILTLANVKYLANNSITLNPQSGGGFRVANGAVFEAKIQPLAGCN